MNGFTLLKSTTWKELFDGWRQREEGEEWEAVAKEKGWQNWVEWRYFMAGQFLAEKRQWTLYQLTDPNQQIPHFLLGPFQSWQTLYFKASTLPLPQRTFAELVSSNREVVEANKKIQAIKNDFPKETELFGLQFPTGEVICMDGTHRCSAVCLAQAEGQAVDFTDRQVTMALAPIGEGEWGLLEAMLKRGSSK